MSHHNSEQSQEFLVSRRESITTLASGFAAAATMGLSLSSSEAHASEQARPWIQIRGLYGGYLSQILEKGQTPADYGINAIWVGSGSLNSDEIERYHQLGLKVFAEFNSMHSAEFLKSHPDAAPIGSDGRPSPAPNGWQGVSPFHEGYRKNRMDDFRHVLKSFAIDGIWLDYHHSHASWEQEEPNLPDTDFSPAALKSFTMKTSIQLPAQTSQAAELLLGEHRDTWTDFRCQVFTDWVREYRRILDEVRPAALLGTFHCPWSPTDLEGAIRHKLAIDLKSQAEFLDVFSIMPYHARFGHANDVDWIARQTTMLGELLGLRGTDDETKKIWPILQMSDWGERVTAAQASSIIESGTRHPATGVMVFHWNGLATEWDKVDAIGATYRKLAGK